MKPNPVSSGVRVPNLNQGGGVNITKVRLRPHPPGQNRISAHPNDRNASTAVRSATPAKMGFKNRVGSKPNY